MAVTKIDVTRQGSFSGDTSIQSHKLTSVSDPTAAQDAATKNYVDNVAQGLSPKSSVVAATTGSESFTISSGSVTQIAGTTVDGVSPAVNDRILIKDAPSSTGTGSVGSTQSGNGIYKVTNATTNLTVSRATDMDDSNDLPAGAYVLVDGGTAAASTGWVVDVPATNAAFTYGTDNIHWVKFTNVGNGTVTTVSVVSANGLAGTVANATTTPAITVSTTVTGLLKGNGTAISAATPSTDYMAPASFVTRETPTPATDGATTAFSLANTPLAGTEQVFLNGILQEPGAGNDYTISGATITYLTAPLTADRLRVSYQK